jgi:hypothetical protein
MLNSENQFGNVYYLKTLINNKCQNYFCARYCLDLEPQLCQSNSSKVLPTNQQ